MKAKGDELNDLAISTLGNLIRDISTGKTVVNLVTLESSGKTGHETLKIETKKVSTRIQRAS